MARAYYCRNDEGGAKNERGFTLIIVLIIAVVGLAMTGLLASVMIVSHASGRVANAEIAKSNLLQSALEGGKGLLKEVMDDKIAAPRYFKKGNDDKASETADITSAANLYLTDKSGKPLGSKKDRVLGKAALGPLSLFGDSGRVTVRIYDMQYDPKLVKAAPGEIEFFPPATHIREIPPDEESYAPGDNDRKPALSGCGIYLVRATLSITDRASGSEKIWILDSAVIQSTRL